MKVISENLENLRYNKPVFNLLEFCLYPVMFWFIFLLYVLPTTILLYFRNTKITLIGRCIELQHKILKIILSLRCAFLYLSLHLQDIVHPCFQLLASKISPLSALLIPTSFFISSYEHNLVSVLKSNISLDKNSNMSIQTADVAQEQSVYLGWSMT